MKDWTTKASVSLRSQPLLRKAVLTLWHTFGICVCYYLAYMLRFEFYFPPEHLHAFETALPPLLILNIMMFYLFRLHAGIWSYFSINDVFRIVCSLLAAFVIYLPTVHFMLGKSFEGYPRSTSIITFLLLGIWMVASRLILRLLREHGEKQNVNKNQGATKNALLVGNLAEINHLIHGINPETSGLGRFVGIVTDDVGSQNLSIRGIPVKGSVENVGAVAKKTKADCILILPPYTRPNEMNKIVASCEESNVACEFRMIPSLSDIASGKIELTHIRKVEIDDLLGRPAITFYNESVTNMIAGKNVMITGAGGSIGSELVRQIARYKPSLMVLFELNEFNLYSIDMETRKNYPNLKILSIAGNIDNNLLTSKIMSKNKIQILIHAAAYKHVPIMEHNVSACIQNNSIGTAHLASEAEKAGVERFVLISTDKAVRPTSIMGASKRIAERILQERPPSNTDFITVRFGNVLGSSGSVIPLFKKQILEGGPITVTDERMTRFFMSIPEAVDLVLQAGSTGKDREIMVLEMGRMIKIADMAKHLIELSGLKVGADIEIEFTGARPGEKMYEELMTDDEDVIKTPYEKIWVIKNTSPNNETPVDINRLLKLVNKYDSHALRKEIRGLVPEATPDIAQS